MRTIFLAGGLGSTILLFGCASSDGGVKPDTAMVPPPSPRVDSACIKDTGSRIPADHAQCTAVGHSFSGDDIERTGATTAGGALRLLDPSVTIR